MESYTGLEEKTKRIGREFFSLIGEEVPSIFDKKRWVGKIMEWSMKDETAKVQLFRFVDALPCLKTDDMVIRLLNEYFEEIEKTPILRGLGLISKRGFFPRIAGRLIRKNVETLARHFIAGTDPVDSWQALDGLRREGLAVTVDLLGEEVLSDVEAARYADRYSHVLHFLSQQVARWQEAPILDRDHRGFIPRLDVSLKLSSFYSRLTPVDWEGSIEGAKAGLRPVMDAAVALGASVTFDMESYYFKDLTLAIFDSILDAYPDFQFLAIALQTYLKETRDDLLGLLARSKKDGRRLGVRLTKGAYWDYETVISRQLGWPAPVLTQKGRTDDQYEELTRLLLENIEYVRPAFATHNIRSICHAIAVVDHLKLPKEAVEFQMIYGMAEPIRRALVRMGYRVRIYSPIGELIPGMAYLIRRLLENTSNESFLRKSFSEDTPPDELTRPPQTEPEVKGEEALADHFVNEPLSDFSKEGNRVQMKDALHKIRREFDRVYPIVAAGKEVFTDKRIESVNPANPAEVVGRVCAAGIAHAQEAIREARKVWAAWKTKSPAERALYLFDAAEIIKKEKFALAALQVYEVGKSWTEADADVAEAIDFLNYYGTEMLRIGAPRVLGRYPGEENAYILEPKGVGVVISPWNFPLAIPAGMISAALVTGNCVLFKPSSLSPVLGWKLFDVLRRVGIPDGVLQFLPGSGEEIGDLLVSHPEVDFVAFTGSKDVGLRIVKLAGDTLPGQQNVKRVIAEMGGKNAIIVDDTADVDAAVKGVLESALGFQGQKCSACSRVIVVGEIFDDFCRRLKQAMESISIGPPENPANFMGPLVDQAALKRIRDCIELGKRDGTPILIRKVSGDGYYVGPAIFADVRPDSPLARDEIFGPVVAVMRAADFDTALEMANDTPYALTGGVFSRSPANIRRARCDFRVGNLYINRKITGALVGRQPFGGFGMSGVGSKAGGPDYLLQFVNAKTICENTLRRGFAPSSDNSERGSK